jgi:hypothetical protein
VQPYAEPTTGHATAAGPASERPAAVVVEFVPLPPTAESASGSSASVLTFGLPMHRLTFDGPDHH